MAALDLPSAKSHLNITASTNDAEIVATIAAAEAAISRHVGPLEPVDKTSRVDGYTSMLMLPVVPVVSLTSVTPVAGTALTVGDLFLDTEAGLIAYNAGGSFGARAYDVVYVAGRAECPDDLLMAVKELVRHMWTTQRGGSQRPGSQPSDALSNSLPGSAYTFPFRVQQLLAPHERPGFA